MARILYSLRSNVWFTDLDFWDARRILKDLAVVKRNFGPRPPGDEFPTKVELSGLRAAARKAIGSRLRKAVSSPPRHVVVGAMLRGGVFEFDPRDYYPARWSPERMLHFTFHRLPLDQPALNNLYKEVRVSWNQGMIRVEQVPRKGKFDPPIRNLKEARRRLHVPSCF